MFVIYSSKYVSAKVPGLTNVLKHILNTIIEYRVNVSAKVPGLTNVLKHILNTIIEYRYVFVTLTRYELVINLIAHKEGMN